jgi:hypothetical protein
MEKEREGDRGGERHEKETLRKRTRKKLTLCRDERQEKSETVLGEETS